MNSPAIARMAGPAEFVADHSWPGTSTMVLRLRAPGGRQMILKINTIGDSFRRELTALTGWASARARRNFSTPTRTRRSC